MSAPMVGQLRAEPNLTPLLDVVFQLITFFMLVINFSAGNHDQRIKLPVAGSARPVEEGEKARFIIRAPYSRWKEVIRKELDPVKGMMQGKLKLKGDLPTIVRYVKAANELVNLAQTVPTEFVDEAS